MLGYFNAISFLLLCGCIASSDRANDVASQSEPVDLELVLAVDKSGSMDGSKLQMQRDGYEKAFRDEEFMQAVKSGPTGRIVVVYVEWAGIGFQNVLVPWTLIERRDDALNIADTLAAQPITHPSRERAGTSISGGLLSALGLFAKSGSRGTRRVVDISGDGTNNSGFAIVPVRDALVARGITINGLPIAVEDNQQFNSWQPGPEQLTAYFETCVIGGQDTFALVVSKSDQFDDVLRRKLMSEIVASISRVVPISARAATHESFDCSAPGEQPAR